MNKKEMKEYRIWKAMKARCYAPSNKDMGYYQKDNITVCSEWVHDFNRFLEDMGKIPDDNYSIDRIDYTKGYYKENCRWIPFNEQSKNRRNVKLYTLNGKTQTLKEWAKELNINYDTLRGRVVRRNIPFEDAIKQDLYNRQVIINNISKTVKEWCTYFNLNAGNVYSRINRGWDKKDAILKPFYKK